MDNALYQSLSLEANINLADNLYGGSNSLLRNLFKGLKTEKEISAFNNRMGLTDWYSVDEFNNTIKKIDKKSR